MALPKSIRPWLLGLSRVIQKAVSHFPSHRFRLAIYQIVYGLKLGRGVVIYGDVELWSMNRIYIGSRSVIGHSCFLDGRRGLTIGEDVNFSSGVWIWTLQHDLRSPTFDTVGGQTIVQDRAWLCSRCTLLPGVTIGEGAVVAAGAVVTKDVAPYTVVAGIPAKPVGERPRNLVYELGDRLPFL